MKRFFDFLLSCFLLVVLFLPFSLVFILVLIKLGRPVFFIQKRPGLKGKVFKIYKFRTMKNSYDSNGSILSDDLRVSKFGQMLRSTSMDELPELFNVLKGDMSLVGPRPLLIEYMPLYTLDQARRHNVKPGITGWAQINGRNSLSWEQKFLLDIWYVDNWSFFLDIKILFITIFKVLRRENISSDGEVSATKFLGNSDHNFIDNN
uniref:sugar transferase n=1 Tax=Polynucleobacter sp. TaxID=2029855 RepID=UPI0040482938